MEGIFTLPYSEYEAINQLTHLFKKSDSFAFFIPLSRQLKDLRFTGNFIDGNSKIEHSNRLAKCYFAKCIK